ncbi:GNAT family N-acetyltransferase [Micromonospora sp. PLK6-60]|uniref:GNAT family N-acetyltransferase n=1 Tax=Micromonospora sp. PLK6-60 TaxID=2873383 RepID=UPI001CA7889B|nr:GNAT family N-acetyltransferase [Micromonospora sp. PLK6-60]MBY8870252.1 GNAT family N-acetyltransferase [Micromonospora sp. PLK6-60]
MTEHRTDLVLRPAHPDDTEAIAALWHQGWRDGHAGHVPAELHRHRRLADFRDRVPPRLPTTTVATLGERLVGFVTVRDDEVEQVYVAGSARGTGVADALLAAAERAVAERFDAAWLAVAVGNARARRFYARCGWRDAAALDYPAEAGTAAGATVTVACRRYEKRVR